jgi:glutaredoxin/glutathione-dependent peroxiredoxin
MAIKMGDKIPDATLMHMTADGPKPITTAEIFDGKKVVLFALPGAFTPTCSNQHLPGFLKLADEIRKKGVATVACLSVNDAFVMGAWGKAQGVGEKILMLADGSCGFTKQLGLVLDMTGFGMGERSKRYAMIVDNRVVKHLGIETSPGVAVESGAEKILSLL